MRLDKSGGFRWLDSWVMSNIIQLGTFSFCDRFLNRTNDPCGRQYDQMTQAARSGRQNNVEGSERTVTSKETEIKLTDVSKASLCELRGDFETWLLRHGQAPWRRNSAEAKTGKNAGKEFWGCTGYPECKGVREIENGESRR